MLAITSGTGAENPATIAQENAAATKDIILMMLL